MFVLNDIYTLLWWWNEKMVLMMMMMRRTWQSFTNRKTTTTKFFFFDGITTLPSIVYNNIPFVVFVKKIKINGHHHHHIDWLVLAIFQIKLFIIELNQQNNTYIYDDHIFYWFIFWIDNRKTTTKHSIINLSLSFSIFWYIHTISMLIIKLEKKNF